MAKNLAAGVLISLFLSAVALAGERRPIDPDQFILMLKESEVTRPGELSPAFQKRMKSYVDQVLSNQPCGEATKKSAAAAPKPAKKTVEADPSVKDLILRTFDWSASQPTMIDQVTHKAERKLDEYATNAERFYDNSPGYGAVWVIKSAAGHTAGDVFRGFADILKFGQGTGTAVDIVFSSNESAKAKAIAALTGVGVDLVRGAALWDLVAGGMSPSSLRETAVEKFPVMGTRVVSVEARALEQAAQPVATPAYLKALGDYTAVVEKFEQARSGIPGVKAPSIQDIVTARARVDMLKAQARIDVAQLTRLLADSKTIETTRAVPAGAMVLNAALHNANEKNAEKGLPAPVTINAAEGKVKAHKIGDEFFILSRPCAPQASFVFEKLDFKKFDQKLPVMGEYMETLTSGKTSKKANEAK